MHRYSRTGRGLVAAVLLANALMAPAAAAAPKVEVSFLSWLDPEFLGKYVDFANTCMKATHPDVTVTGQTTAGTSVNYNGKVVSSLAAGAGADLYYFNLGSFDPTWIKNGLMLQVDTFLNNDPAFKADLPPALLAAWRYKGALYGLPSTIGQYAVYYNRDQFAAAGLTAPSPDWTMENEFAGDIRKLAKVDDAGKLSQYGLQLQTSLSGRFMNYVFSNGGRAVDEDVTKAQLDQPAFVDTIRVFKGLLDSNLITTGGTGAAYNKFVAGTTSMLMTGIFYQGRVAAHSPFDWGVAPIPAGKAGRYTVANTNAWVINPHSAHPDLAWDLAKCFTDANFARFALKEGLEFPVALSALRSDFFATLPSNLSHQEGQYWLDAIDYIKPFPKSPLMPQIWKIAQGHVNDVWKGKDAPVTALKAAAAQIDALIGQPQ